MKRKNLKNKRFLIAGLCLMLVLAACGPSKPTDEETTTEATSTETQEETTQEETTQEETTPEETTPEETTPEETTPEETVPGVTFTEVNEKVYCTTTQVNVRKEPGTHGAIFGQLTFDEELTRTGIGDNGWSRVIYQDKVAYVSSDYLSTQKQGVIVPTNVKPGTGILHEGTNGILICIDPGHQLKGNYEKEPLGPGSSELKAKVSAGTSGVVTGVAEYIVNLQVSLKLRDALLAEGYSVLMIRETHEVNISNAERALLANQAKADAFLRIHCNSEPSGNARGIVTMAPSDRNPYCANIADASQRLSRLLINAMCEKTGFKDAGIQHNDQMTGINWCQVPMSIIEMGFMSNPEDDRLLVSNSTQDQMVQGIVKGINSYFGK